MRLITGFDTTVKGKKKSQYLEVKKNFLFR